MFAVRKILAGLAFSGLLACAHQPPAAPPAAPPPPGPATVPEPAAVPPVRPAAVPAPAPNPTPTPNPTPAARPATGPATHASALKRSAPAAAPSAVASGPPAAASVPIAAPAPATLDLRSLEERLRETHAIGVFTKLSLKNQVDDLLGQFRAFYAGHGELTLADLRRSYELLLMKVVTLLQDADPGLASAVASSRDAIWGILSDRTRFNNL